MKPPGRAPGGRDKSCRSLRWTMAIFLFALHVAPAVGQGPSLRGDPFRGREIFAQKLCVRCHSVWGHGGMLGPDMSSAVSRRGWLDLVGDFWNHTPRMLDAVVKEGYAWPRLEAREMSDLLTYLYYLRLFDEPGDAGSGAVAYARLGCDSCHTLGGEGTAVAGPLDRFSAYPSSLILAQEMWNAGPAMQAEQLGRGRSIPNFTGMEMADIQAHIRARGIREDRDVKLLPLLDPGRGASVFKEKRCAACHAGGREGPDLAVAARDKTFAEISGILWNHSYTMNDRMRARGIPFPRFDGTEMGDLISYLHFLSFFATGGDPGRGAVLFETRGCAACHADPASSAPRLSDLDVDDPMVLSAAMWNHAPGMHELMAAQSVAWPSFDPGDMANLVAFLRSGVPSE